VSPPSRQDESRVDRPSVWPLILLLAGLAVLAGIFAAVFAFTDSGPRLSGLVGKDNKSSAPHVAVPLTGVASFDPDGDQHEHDEDVALATDRDPATYWTTEHYNSGLQKPGVGLVLDAGAAKKLASLTVASDTPGFVAVIKAGDSRAGGFRAVSSSGTVGTRAKFSLDGDPARYYLLWITDLGPNAAVHVNEVTARS
jgi:eukaryotic-like serine/threonine-protein kinase